VEKKSDSSFFKIVLIASLVSFVIAAYPVKVYLSEIQIYSVICGYIISLANALAGYRLSEAALRRSSKVFFAFVFGGMGVRMLAVCIILLLLISFSQLDLTSLVGSVFGFYVMFMAIEIYCVHKMQILVSFPRKRESD